MTLTKSPLGRMINSCKTKGGKLMKRLVIIGAALACALPALAAASAGDQTLLAASGDKPVAKNETQAAARNAAAPKRRSRATEDARHCLNAGDNAAIIRCAEKYR